MFDKAQNRPDQHTGKEIAQHRPHAEPGRNWHGNHGGAEKNRHLEQKTIHVSGCPLGR